MDEDLQRLENKIDQLSAKLDEVSKKLEQVIMIPKYGEPLQATKKTSKKEAKDEQRASMKRYIELKLFHGRKLQIQFNLAVPPSVARIENYLKTNDPKAFDGLKRNK